VLKALVGKLSGESEWMVAYTKKKAKIGPMDGGEGGLGGRKQGEEGTADESSAQDPM